MVIVGLLADCASRKLGDRAAAGQREARRTTHVAAPAQLLGGSV